jgi:hypothetical protein
MNGSDVNALVLEYLGGHLGADREEALKSLLAQHGYTAEELDDLRETYARLDELPIPAASREMTERFYQMLEAHKGQAVVGPGRFVDLMVWLRDRCDHRFFARIACGLVLLGIGWSLGSWSAPNERYEQRLDDVTAEIREVKGMMAYAMLSQSSSGERLRTINQIKTCGAVNEGMIAVLLNMLRRDPNVNVRLVALETLAAQTDRPTVRQGLVESLSQQESPLVQLALADVLFSLDRAVFRSALRRLLERPDLNDAVRARITDGLERLM